MGLKEVDYHSWNEAALCDVDSGDSGDEDRIDNNPEQEKISFPEHTESFAWSLL